MRDKMLMVRCTAMEIEQYRKAMAKDGFENLSQYVRWVLYRQCKKPRK